MENIKMARSTKAEFEAIKQYIKENYKEMSDLEMSEHLNLKKQTVKAYRCRMGLFLYEQEAVGHIKGEIWRPTVKEGYFVSNKGRVKNKDDKIVRSHVNDRGYCITRLGRGKVYRVHRLVAFAFLSQHEDPSFNEVNHKDGNKLNNSAYNLEWSDRSSNISHAYELGLRETISTYMQRKASTTIPEGSTSEV